MLTITFALVMGAFILTLASAAGRCPVWVPVILLCIAEMLPLLPK